MRPVTPFMMMPIGFCFMVELCGGLTEAGRLGKYITGVVRARGRLKCYSHRQSHFSLLDTVCR